MNTKKRTKDVVQILMNPETHQILSKLYEEKYQERYSFSVFLEEMLLVSLRELGAI